MEYLSCVEIETGTTPVNASVIWLHGLGADGYDFVPVISELNLPDHLAIRFLFPHAPELPVTVNGGYLMPAWYDILEMNLERKIDLPQLLASARKIQALIEREIARGIPSQRVLLAGFSQGGAVVYQAGLSFDKPLAGLLAMSSYLAGQANLEINPANQLTPILIQHGLQDHIVPDVLGQRAFRFLSDSGSKPEYESYAMDHSLCAEQIEAISRWIQRIFKQ
uniref:alpha/beta hydrolase n=1 Tax=Cellvibrio fontiphilus TaxID=1815559 RepID=UPI002B4BF146|nr:alpha/beta hydrolase [Cellvibrio fontiphilus]